MALFGFDDIEALEWLNYKISVIDRDVSEMGEQAMRLLVSRIESGKKTEERSNICLPTKLILRGSERYPTK